MGVQRFEVGAFGQHHVQRAGLHGRLLQPHGMQQVGGAGAGAEYDALRTDVTAVHAQADQFFTFAQRFDVLTSQQAVTCQFGQVGQQAGHVDDQFSQAVDLAFERAVLQGGWQLLALT